MSSVKIRYLSVDKTVIERSYLRSLFSYDVFICLLSVSYWWNTPNGKINMRIFCSSQTRTWRYDSLIYVYELWSFYEVLPVVYLKKVEKYTARFNIATRFKILNRWLIFRLSIVNAMGFFLLQFLLHLKYDIYRYLNFDWEIDRKQILFILYFE